GLGLGHAFEQPGELRVLHRHRGLGIELAALAGGFDQFREDVAAVAHALLRSWDPDRKRSRLRRCRVDATEVRSNRGGKRPMAWVRTPGIPASMAIGTTRA